MRGQAFLSIDTDVLAFFIFACAPGAPPIERRSADTRPGALDVLDMHDDETSADDWQRAICARAQRLEVPDTFPC